MKVPSETFPDAGLTRHVCDRCRKPIIIMWKSRDGEFCSNQCLIEAQNQGANMTDETTGTATETAPEPKKTTKKGTAKVPKKGAQGARGAKSKAGKAKATTKAKKAPKSPRGEPREGTKTAKVIALLKQKGGVKLDAIIKATGWNKNSVFGFISGTIGKKLGMTVKSEKDEKGNRIYSVK